MSPAVTRAWWAASPDAEGLTALQHPPFASDTEYPRCLVIDERQPPISDISPPRGTRRGALSFADLAASVASALRGGDEKRAWRLLLQAVDDFRGSSSAGRVWMVADEPPPTGDRRYDAAIAALAEHLCAASPTPIPSWTSQPSRSVEPWWFPAGLPALESAALRDSPVSFKRHGVFVTARAFIRV